jgi:hypothetical protein
MESTSGTGLTTKERIGFIAVDARDAGEAERDPDRA